MVRSRSRTTRATGRLRTGAAIALAAASALAGEGGSQEVPDTLQEGEAAPLRVFLDCEVCDLDHFRREVPYVAYVRDRQVAEVHVLVNIRRTGGQGTEHTFAFIGLERFAGRQDTLVWASLRGDTEAAVRDGLVRTFQLGLMRYVAATPLAERISIAFERAAGAAVERAAVRAGDDPWHVWVFEIGAGGEVEGEERERDVSVNGSLEASRVTAELKLELDARIEWNQERFELDDRVETSTTSSFDGDGLVVWSVGPHWAAGVGGSAVITTEENQDLTLRGGEE